MSLTLDFVLAKSAGRIAALNSIVADKAEQVLRLAYAEGINIMIVQGLRTMEEQARIYAQGRTTPGAIISNAKPGYSYHNYGLAIDYALLNYDGNDVIWDVTDQWRRVGAIGESLGFNWGGRWTMQREGIVDFPHLEMSFGLSFSDLISGKKPPEKKEEPIVPIIEAWKQKIHDDAKAAGLITSDWSTKLNDPAPVWMVLGVALAAQKK